MRKALALIDRRRSFVKHQAALGRSQMVRYFQARYSWGQPCDPRRADDWGTLCAVLRTGLAKGVEVDWHERLVWPSGNAGSIAGMVGVYHDGHELLHDLGLIDDQF